MQREGEELIQCPYDSSHRILKKRMQNHVRKCGKNHHHVDKVKCPFNVTHVLDKSELESHITRCESRVIYENFKNIDSAVEEPAEKSEMLELHTGYTVSSWDDEDVPTYNPQAYVQSANVLRSMQGATPSARKQFRQQERLRFLSLNNKPK